MRIYRLEMCHSPSRRDIDAERVIGGECWRGGLRRCSRILFRTGYPNHRPVNVQIGAVGYYYDRMYIKYINDVYQGAWRQQMN